MLLTIPVAWPKLSAATLAGLTLGLPLALWLASAVDVARLDPNRCRGLRWGEFALFLLGHYLVAWMLLEVVSRFAVDSVIWYGAVDGWDEVLLDKYAPPTWEPSRGARVAYNIHRLDDVSRLFGREGDEVRLVNGQMFINGWKVPRCAIPMSRWDNSEYAIEFLEGRAYLTEYRAVFRDGSFVERDERFIAKRGQFILVEDSRLDGSDWQIVLRRSSIVAPVLFTWRSGPERHFGRTDEEPQLPSLWKGNAEYSGDDDITKYWRDATASFHRCLKARPPFEDTVPPPPREMPKPE